MTHFKPLQTSRLVLRPLTGDDADDLFAYRSLEEVSRYQGFRPRTLSDVHGFLAGLSPRPDVPDTWFQLGIRTREDDHLIGDLGIHFLSDSDQAEIGFTLAPSQQKKGYALEAAQPVLSALFSEWKKHRVIASVDPRNEASIRLLLKLGMRKEAHFRKRFRLEDGWGDDCIYAILEEEWLK
jgi:RimJ/RimL family protein N-acetyltransferase